MSELKRFRRMVTESELRTALENPGQFPDEPLGSEIDLSELEEVVGRILESDALEGTAIDQELAEPITSSLGELTKREGSDMRVWHWLAVKKFPDLVRRRWGKEDSTEGVPIPTGLANHFLGKPTLAGSSRNTFSRIWWVTKSLDGDIERAKAVLGDADAMSGIFDRFFSATPLAARAAIDRLVLEGIGEDDQRAARRWLQQALGTTVLEVLTEEEVKEVLSQRLDQDPV